MLKKVVKSATGALGYRVSRVRDLANEPASYCDIKKDIIPPRVLVITQPKAGTYLVAELLRNMGFKHTYLHLGERKLQAYDPADLDRGLSFPREFDVDIPLSQSRKLIRSGEVGVAHLSYSEDNASLLRGHKIVLVKRELRSMLVSWARMLKFSARFGPDVKSRIDREGVLGFLKLQAQQRIDQAIQINRWRDEEGVLEFKMEDLLRSPEIYIKKIAMHAHVQGALDDACWEEATRARTLTSSDRYPALGWTDAEEAFFVSIGGKEANRNLGYDE